MVPKIRSHGADHPDRARRRESLKQLNEGATILGFDLRGGEEFFELIDYYDDLCSLMRQDSLCRERGFCDPPERIGEDERWRGDVGAQIAGKVLCGLARP